MMRLIARNSSNAVIASNDIVLPVSDEMDCRACHASGSQSSAKPAAGWVWNGQQERDFRLNILRLHDEHQFARHNSLYVPALNARGFNSQGLYRGVIADGKPVLCAACHASEALGAPSYGTIPQLTTSVHSFHAHVTDPVLNTTLDSATNRSACYRCHPGSTTKCLRGAMGASVATDGSMAMQCQSCHGNMSAVGSGRTGWFDEPNCQSCHTGTAVSNMGQIRYTSAINPSTGSARVPSNWNPASPPTGLNATFATTANTPATGLSLYRFSYGHGGLQCSACHGSTHAEFPSAHVNDNVRNTQLQGHAGMMVECTSCHVSMTASTTNVTGGPHGLHPITQDWVNNHHDLVGKTGGSTQCKVCHGTDYRGTVLSRAQSNRSWSAFNTTITFSKGDQIGCYNCHQGPSEGDRNPSTAPTVSNKTASTTNNQSVAITLPSTGTGVTLRVISQPANGSVGLVGTVATYFPNPGFTGTDTFTYSAFNGSMNSNLSTVTISVGQGPISLTANAQVPATYPAGWDVAYAVVPTATNTTASPTFDWSFGDGSAHDTRQFPTHIYAAAGTYQWGVTIHASTAAITLNGSIVISSPLAVGINQSGSNLTLSWPASSADTLLQTSSDLGMTSPWQWVTASPVSNGNSFSVTIPKTGNNQFYRLVRPW